MLCYDTDFDIKDWISCQVSSDKLFQIKNGESICRVILGVADEFGSGVKRFIGNDLPRYVGHGVYFPALCNVRG